MQVIRDPGAHCAIELARYPDSVLLAKLDEDTTITLVDHPATWFEIGQQFNGGKREWHFDEVWKPLTRVGPNGIEPYPPLEAIRKLIRGCFSAPAGFKGGALEALAAQLPSGDHHLFDRESGFIGRFASHEDALMIAAALRSVKPIVFDSPEGFGALPVVDQGVVLFDLDPDRDWPAKITHQLSREVFEMSKKQTAKKPKKQEKGEARQRRADGPVAQARAIFEKMKDATSADIIAACEKAGVNRGTASTQLGRWRKENGIAVKRGGARKKSETQATAAPKKTKAAKSKPAVETKKGKGKSGPVTITRPKKSRSKSSSPSQPEAAETPSSKATPPAPKKAKKPAKSAPASPSAGTASAGSESEAAASTSPAAPSPTPAGGEPTN